MPMLPNSPCTSPRCTHYAVKRGRCDKHQPKEWNHKGKSSSERGYGKAWRRLRKIVLVADGYMCRMCKEEGVYTKADEVDHITPKSQGGTDAISNLQSICKPHHKQKTLKESKHASA